MEDSEDIGKQHIVGRDFVIPILVGIVGVAGSLGGVYMGNINNTHQVEIQKAAEYESKLLDQRLAIIDRTAKVFGRSPGLSDLWERYLKPIQKAKEAPELEKPPDVVEKLMDAQGEFQSVLFLAQAYFGPKTKAAIAELGADEGPWWTKPKAKQDALVAAMIEEASLGLRVLPNMLQRVQ
jgi:hypothetical protein